MDEYFNEFLTGEGFSPPFNSVPLDEETILLYQNRLPERLLGYWKEYGFSGFGEGLFWMVNPSEYQDILEKWLKQTHLWERESFYVIARTAFGELYVRGDKSNSSTIINPHLNKIIPGDAEKLEPTVASIDRGIGIFFELKNKESLDYEDDKGKPLFQRCLKKYGPLGNDEMYTFSTALALGGSADIENIKKVKILEQLSMLCDLDTPVVLPSASELFGSVQIKACKVDQYFNEFLNYGGFTPIAESTSVDKETYEGFQNKLPSRLLKYWKEYGFTGFSDGLFWIVNPNNYQDTLNKWLQKTPLAERESYYVIARSAFGELYIWGDKSRSVTILNPHLNNILPGDFSHTPLDAETTDKAIGVFLWPKARMQLTTEIKMINYYLIAA